MRLEGRPEESPAVSRRIVITRRAALDVRDGINILIFSLADALLRAGHEVTVVASQVGQRERLKRMYAMRAEPAFVEVAESSRLPAIEGLSLDWITTGRRAIAERQPDLVIVNGVLPFSLPGHVCVVAHDLGWATAPRRLDKVRKMIKRFAAARAQTVAATSPEVRDGLARQLDRTPESIRVIAPCVDVEAAVRAPRAQRQDAILHPGTGDYKDPAASVRAFARLRRPTTRLLVEGEPTEALRTQVAALPSAVRDRVELLGELPADALRSLLGTVRLASFPTRYVVPTASSTVVEAIAAGTPIAGSDRLSHLVLRDGATGLAATDDVTLAAAYARLLDEDTTWDAMSAAAMAMAADFDAATVADDYLSVLRDAPT